MIGTTHTSVGGSSNSPQSVLARSIPPQDSSLADSVMRHARGMVPDAPSALENSVFTRWVDAIQKVHGRSAQAVRAYKLPALEAMFPAAFLESVQVIARQELPAFHW